MVSDVRAPRPRRMRPQQTAISRQHRQHSRPWRLVGAFVLLRLPEEHHLQPFSTFLVWTEPNSGVVEQLCGLIYSLVRPLLPYSSALPFPPARSPTLSPVPLAHLLFPPATLLFPLFPCSSLSFSSFPFALFPFFSSPSPCSPPSLPSFPTLVSLPLKCHPSSYPPLLPLYNPTFSSPTREGACKLPRTQPLPQHPLLCLASSSPSCFSLPSSSFPAAVISLAGSVGKGVNSNRHRLFEAWLPSPHRSAALAFLTPSLFPFFFYFFILNVYF